MRFGVGHWKSRESIRENLRKFDTEMDTKQQYIEFWNGGLVKIIRGEIALTDHKTGKTVTPALAYFWYMSPDDPSKLFMIYGLVGTEEF